MLLTPLSVLFAAFAGLVVLGFNWMDKRVAKFSLPGSENHKIAWAVAGLIGSVVAMALSYHYARLPSDVVFLVVLIVLLFAIWIAFRSSRTLLPLIAERTPKFAAWIPPLIVALGLALAFALGKPNGIIALVVCFLLAGGYASTRPRSNPKPD